MTAYADPTLAAHLRTGWFTTVDPGVEHPAVAIFDRGTLVHASRVRVPCVAKMRELEEGERVRQVVKLICEHVWRHAPREYVYMPPYVLPLAIIHEWPKTLQRGKGSKNSADQLFPLAAIGTGVAIRFDVPAISPQPDDWTGQIPKDDSQPDGWNSPRGRIIKARTRPEELAAIAIEKNGFVAHDTVDAVGIGYKYLGRLERTYGLAT